MTYVAFIYFQNDKYKRRCHRNMVRIEIVIGSIKDHFHTMPSQIMNCDGIDQIMAFSCGYSYSCAWMGMAE